MFSAYYKTKLKNKLKNKSICSDKTNSSFGCLLQRSSLSLSPYLCRSTHNSKLSVIFSPDLLFLNLPISVAAASSPTLLVRHLAATTAAPSSPLLLLLLDLGCCSCCLHLVFAPATSSLLLLLKPACT